MNYDSAARLLLPPAHPRLSLVFAQGNSALGSRTLPLPSQLAAPQRLGVALRSGTCSRPCECEQESLIEQQTRPPTAEETPSRRRAPCWCLLGGATKREAGKGERDRAQSESQARGASAQVGAQPPAQAGPTVTETRAGQFRNAASKQNLELGVSARAERSAQTNSAPLVRTRCLAAHPDFEPHARAKTNSAPLVRTSVLLSCPPPSPAATE